MAALDHFSVQSVKILDIYPYNTAVHILVSPEAVGEFASYDYKIIKPSLEDVFVFYVKTQRKGLWA